MPVQTVRKAVPDRTGKRDLASMANHTERKPTRYGFRRSAVTNWRELRHGDTVVLVGTSKERVSGTVDAVTADGDMVWILQDNGAGRKLFHNLDIYKTFIDPKAF